MSAATTETKATKAAPIADAFTARWIIGPRDDLVWFIGSVAASYALFALYVGGLVPLIPMVVAWAILVDAPHVFATFTRTYFDREERRTRGRLLWWSLLFFAAGPVAVLAGAGYAFFFVAALWAYYHLVKQHYGFMVLYKKKNGDLEKIDNALDRAFLLAAFTYPFVRFVAEDPEALKRVPAFMHAGLGTLERVVLVPTVILTALWLGRQAQRAVRGRPLNVPKYLLLAAAVPMHWVVLLTPMAHKPIAIVAMLTVYHNLQYHRLVWFHNRKYARDGACRERHGAAHFLSRRVFHYAVFGLVFGLWYQVPRQYVNHAADPASFYTQLASGFLWGYALLHYYLDSKIWRVRRDASVGRALKMG
ncbi:MAG TPA: hypothetical protein VK422_03430 [Pyrinomonadaceae bacterium]|nr:hypothetical protein [Pyrinomonadaceae bacterium]